MHRFANGVPMVDTNTSAACALVAGVASKVGWANLGLKISSSRVQRGDGRLRFILSEAPTPLKVPTVPYVRINVSYVCVIYRMMAENVAVGWCCLCPSRGEKRRSGLRANQIYSDWKLKA